MVRKTKGSKSGKRNSKNSNQEDWMINNKK
jgi:hypothetical protein